MEVLHGKERKIGKKNSAKKTRLLGNVPGILYGEHLKNIMFEIGAMELNKEISLRGEHGIIDFAMDGVTQQTLIKEIQRDPVNHNIIHIDLEKIDSNKLIHSEVPIVYKGEDDFIKSGRVLQREKDSIRIQCKAENLPKHIHIDLSNASVGNVFRVSDLNLGSDIVFIDDLSTIISTIADSNTNMLSTEDTKDEEPEVILKNKE